MRVSEGFLISKWTVLILVPAHVISSLCLSFASFFKYGSSLPDLSQGTCITVVACVPHFRFSELSCQSPVLASQQASLLVEENLFGTWTGHSCTMGFDLYLLFDLRIRFLWTITYLLAVLSQLLAAREPEQRPIPGCSILVSNLLNLPSRNKKWIT